MLTELELRTALNRAFSLGQTYWQQADSEYTSQHRKADQTRAKFEALVAETIAAAGVGAVDATRRECSYCAHRDTCATAHAGGDCGPGRPAWEPLPAGVAGTSKENGNG